MDSVGDKTQRLSPRLAAARTLAAVGRGGKLDAVLDRLVRSRLPRRDASFAEELVKAVLRHRLLLDYQLASVTSRPLAKVPPAVREVLRLAAAELFLLRTPAYAAVDEAVAALKASQYAGLAAFANAALRSLAAREEVVLPAGDDVERLSVQYSFPPWFVRRWVARRGREEAEALLAAQNEPAPLNIYANPGRASGDELAEALRGDGCEVREGAFGSWAVTLGDKGLRELRAFAEGWGHVIDPASAVGPRWLAPPPGATVLDLCAGAGGKAVQLAWAVGPEGKVVAVDRNARQLKAGAAAARRLGLAQIEFFQADLLKEVWPAADYVFLDVPCTNLGVIRRKPDVKWRLGEEDVAAAATVQRAMLARVMEVVGAGATVLYNVCSLEPEETEEVLEAVASEAAVEVVPYRGEEFAEVAEGPYLRTWPSRHECNGGFAAKLRKSS
jgi:16S rRNA (cytosine967-C5)-methyltransferase